MAIIRHKLDLKRRPAFVHQDHSANVATNQPVRRQVTRQSDRVEFIDRGHVLESGCAVTKRGATAPVLINHALRIFQLAPSGLTTIPSTAKRVPN
jgi:hypothetical protein